MDEGDLWRRYRENQDQAAWEKLVELYAPLVKHVAARLRLVLPAHVEFEDLVSSGVFGLLAAIERFQPERGIKFETFATPRIRGAILDSLRAADWAPRSLRQQERRLSQAYGRLERRLGRPATAREVCEELGVTLQELRALEREVSQAVLLSLDAALKGPEEGEEITLGARIASEYGDPVLALEQEEKKRLLAAAIRELPEKEKLVIALYYYEDLNIKEIAQVLKVTESRVSQLHTRALLRLRGKLGRYQEELELAERTQNTGL
ncbi:MAG: polymerase sigma factor FliA [Bacillota bacterium]|nr:polymerase sigma factor FliA [Bacillota bacterium]MDK2855181.1 polymerase sigma factor FliA [Bacillota bacterium]MDK2925021.1 polymerase sigma factor FliA [Bacillota bacterium]